MRDLCGISGDACERKPCDREVSFGFNPELINTWLMAPRRRPSSTRSCWTCQPVLDEPFYRVRFGCWRGDLSAERSSVWRPVRTGDTDSQTGSTSAGLLMTAMAARIVVMQ